jgi:protein-L-isoaspartate O-methyltransferase
LLSHPYSSQAPATENELLEKPMGLVRKLYAGDRLHRTRLHDEKGNFVGWQNIVRHAPPALATGLLRLGLGYRPEQPWIAYTAIQRLEEFLTPHSRVLEFGSGMSTLWFAKHAGAVYSVEDYRLWYDKVNAVIAQKQLHHVHYQFAENVDDYAGYMSNDAEGFDLIMVDGNWRSDCIAKCASKLKPGGILYLDNSDKDSTPNGGDMRLAEERALAFAREQSASVEYFTDFAPTQLFVQQGLLVRLPQV